MDKPQSFTAVGSQGSSVEPPPSYANISSPFGLEHLGTLSRVDIKQKHITTEHGEILFALKRDVVKKHWYSTPVFFFDLLDKTGRLVITMKPKNSCCGHRLEIHVEGQYLCKVTASSAFSSDFVVSDAQGANVLKICVPGITQRQRFLLKLKDMKGNQIGNITKKWHGIADEVFSDSNELQVDFPQELGLQYKAGVIGFCIALIQQANIQYNVR